MQKNSVRSTPDLFFWGSITLWFLFLFFQSGNWLDEAEHCNAAWLMGNQGLRPFHDFFQHHSPLLWDWLAVFYRMGGSGAKVLFFGRFLVVLCGLACLFSLRFLTKTVAGFQNSNFAFALTAMLFGAFTIGHSSTFVIRPETPALALGALALVLWRGGSQVRAGAKPHGLNALGGVLWGLGAFSSPRLALASPIFFALLLPATPQKVIQAALVALLGAVIGFFGYAILFHHSMADLDFIFSFSRTFQKVGNINGFFALKLGSSPPLFGPFVLLALAYYWLFTYAVPATRRRILLHALWIAVMFALATALSWPHAYPQNLMVVYFYAVFALPDILSRQQWRVAPAQQQGLGFFSLFFALAVGAALFSDNLAKAGLVNSYRVRDEMLKSLRPEETVMLPYMLHPIAARNASFYGGYQDDGTNRTCRAVALSRFKDTLPPCDFLADLIQKKPVLVEASTLALSTEPEQQPAVALILANSYDPEFTLREPKNYAIFKLKSHFRQK